MSNEEFDDEFGGFEVCFCIENILESYSYF